MSLEEFWFLIKGVCETTKNESKEHKGGFFEMLLGILGASLLGNLLTGRGTIRAGLKKNHNRWKFFMSSHPVTNFETQKYYLNEHKFNDVFSRDNLSKIKGGHI